MQTENVILNILIGASVRRALIELQSRKSRTFAIYLEEAAPKTSSSIDILMGEDVFLNN